MKYVIIVGSHRGESQSSKVGAYVKGELEKMDSVETVDIIDLKDNPLPLRHDVMWGKDESNEMYQERIAARGPIREKLDAADAFVIVAPERNGTAPAGLKNLFHYASAKVMGNKPAMLVAVSSGMGGAYPIAELRMSSYKNSQICYIPQHVIVRHVGKVLNDHEIDEDREYHDASIKRRIHYSLNVLAEYAKGLKSVRESGVVNLEDYPYGM